MNHFQRIISVVAGLLLLTLSHNALSYGIDIDTLSEEEMVHYDSIFQDSLRAYEKDLKKLQDSILYSENPDARADALTKYIPALVQALQVPGSIDYPFEDIEFMFTQTPEDESFRLYNWVMEFDDGGHRYYGAIQMNTTDEFKLFPLTDLSDDLPDKPDNMTLGHEEWYGALYYEMVQIEDGNNTYYTLLGWDGHDRTSQLKMVDVLTFDRFGNPQFGAPVFEVVDDEGDRRRQHRVFFQYSERAVMSMNVADGTDIIVFDKLVPLAGNMPGGEQEMVPDGSYSSFVFESGLWRQVDQPFDTLDDLQGEDEQGGF